MAVFIEDAAPISVRSRRVTEPPPRFDHEMLIAICDALDDIYRDARKEYERARFIFSFLILTPVFVGEIPKLTMGNLRSLQNEWWLVIDFGPNRRRIPVPNNLMVELERYRQSRQLVGEPRAGENAPLIASLTDLGKSIDTRHVNRLVKLVLVRAAQRLMPTDPIRADLMNRASVKWLKYTSLGIKATNGVCFDYMRRDAGYATPRTTQNLVIVDESLRHAASSNLDLPWSQRV